MILPPNFIEQHEKLPDYVLHYFHIRPSSRAHLMLTMPKRVLACYTDLTDDCKPQSAAPIMVSPVVICCKVKNAEFRFLSGYYIIGWKWRKK